jgi:hypothetical protein
MSDLPHCVSCVVVFGGCVGVGFDALCLVVCFGFRPVFRNLTGQFSPSYLID